MEHWRLSAADSFRYWSSSSGHLLEAAGYLPQEKPELELARRTLLRMAVSHVLKAYLCAARGGAPVSEDLGRLTALARYCGLSLTDEQTRGLAALAQTLADAQVPNLPWVRTLCAGIAAQADALEPGVVTRRQ